MENKKILYFCYGASRSPNMMKAIIGRRPRGFKYELNGYELCLQYWNEIPKKVKNILSRHWDKSFRSYSIKQSPRKSVWGVVWIISKEEYALAGNWELRGMWYKKVRLKRKIHSKNKIILTEMVNPKGLKPVKESKNYTDFPVSKKKIISVANKVRKEFLSMNSKT